MSEFNNPKFTFKAGGTIAVATFVKLSGEYTVSQSSTGDKSIGVAQEWPNVFNGTNAATVGQQVGVYMDGQIALLTLGTGGATAGDRLTPDSSGNGVTATVQYGSAIALQDGIAGSIIQVEVVTSDSLAC